MCNLESPGTLVTDKLRSQMGEHLPGFTQYACRFWVDHLRESQTHPYHDMIYAFFKVHFLHWLEALGLMGNVSDGVGMIRSLETMFVNVSSQLDSSRLLKQNPKVATDFLSFMRDADRFIQYNMYIIENAPLQVYASALVFSPTMSRIRILFEHEQPPWVNIRPQMERYWSSRLQTLEGHEDSVCSVTFSRGGKRLASSSGDGTVRIWDAQNGQLLNALKGNGLITFSRDGKWLASGSGADKTLRIWNAENGQLLNVLKGHDGCIMSVAFSRDSKRLASTFDDGTVQIWNAETGQLQQTLLGNVEWPNEVASFSADGERLASTSCDGTVQIRNVETGQLQQTLLGYAEWYNSLAFSEDGERLASGSIEGTVQIWALENGQLQQTFKGHHDSISSLAFSHDGKWLASGSTDNTVKIWDADSGQLQKTLEDDNSLPNSTAFSHDGKRLASSSRVKTVQIWDADTGRLLRLLNIGGSVSVLTFSPDGRSLSTEIGYIALDGSPLSVQTPDWSAYCVHADRSWITWNGNKVLWIPWEYRPIRSIVRDQTVAIGCSSGRVLLIGFNVNFSPVTRN
ncbi:WD40-repeat-containing domain protein [Xylogone sp. PMI_703]|nr:WD40-repeat-containing domain protein [Xylogone sp. PMI_703]